ncbi:hypothetical protein HYZ64_03015 [Candidatus Berkelbacteria bacterium]|nr:hypothetical protein [Candidatus Berkelbacteria bacterium]
MNKGLKHLARIGAGAGAAMSVAKVAFAQPFGGFFDPETLTTPGGVTQSRFGSVNQAVNTIFNTVIAAAAAIFVILLLVGGVQYLGAAGNEESTAKAKKLLIDAVIGLIIVLAAWAVGRFVLSRFFQPGAGVIF